MFGKEIVLLWKNLFLIILKIKNMNKIIFPLILFLLNGFLFTESPSAYSQNSYISVNITAKQALKKKYKFCKVTSTVKNGFKTTNERYKRKVLTCEKLDSLEKPFTALIKLGLSKKVINNKTPRDSFLLLFPNAQKINDTAFYLYALPLPPRDTSFLIPHQMGSHPWQDRQAIYFDSSGMIKNINSGGGAGEECCAGGDSWYQTIRFKDNICYTSTRHSQQANEEIETKWDPSLSFPITVTKNAGNNAGYSKTTYTYLFRRGILYKMTELTEGKTSPENKTIVYKYHYKK